MTEKLLCRWCGKPAVNGYDPLACSKDHHDIITGILPNPDIQESMEHNEKTVQIKLFAKFVNHQLAAWSALFELITGDKPPKMKEILAIISGH